MRLLMLALMGITLLLQGCMDSPDTNTAGRKGFVGISGCPKGTYNSNGACLVHNEDNKGWSG